MRYPKLIISTIAFTFFNAVSVMNVRSQTLISLKRLQHRLDSVRCLDSVRLKANVEIWKKAALEALEIEKDYELGPISYKQTISELEKEEKDARLKRINEEIETYKRLVSQEVKNTTPTFGLDTCYIESKQITEVEGNKSYNYTNISTNIIPIPFAYAKTTFSSQREILDFIKSIDFDRNPPIKRFHEFYNDEKKITEDKVLRKGIELYQKEKVKKAVNYFSKISTSSKYSEEQRDYAEYQVAHYNYYGKFDIYYNGVPSQMDRSDVTWKWERYVTCPIIPELFMLADPQLSTYDPIRLLSYIVEENYKYNRKGYLYADLENSHADNHNHLFTRELLAALLYEAFPKGVELKTSKLSNKAPMEYWYYDKINTDQKFCTNISDFFNWMDCLHIIARTDWNQKEYYGIGLSANELYNKVKKINPNKQFNLYDYEKGSEYESQHDEQCQVFLLRSAYYGHPDAMLELLPYIIIAVQSGYKNGVRTSKFFEKEYKKDYEGTKLFLNQSALNSICAILGKNEYVYVDGLPKLGPLKDYAYIWEAMGEAVNKAYKQINKQYRDLRYARQAEEQAKKEQRKQFWSNMGTALLNGLASGANAYMQTQYQVSAPMNTAPLMAGNYTGTLANAMSQPGYFQNVHQQLLQQSMNQVQWAEMQEYNSVRENYQRMGGDLSLNEFRTLKGQAISNLKEQGYDIIAEQKAINDDMRDFNRSQMNSGKENVERIKQQNAQKYGTSSISNTTTKSSNSYSPSSKPTTSSKVSSSTASGASTNITNVHNTKTPTSSKVSSSTTSKASTNTTSVHNTKTTYDAHEQYKSGNLNTQKSSYGDKIKNVSMAVKDGASFRNVNLHGELYKKDGQYYVKIGSSFFKVETPKGSYKYNSYIVYGAKAHYFNK